MRAGVLRKLLNGPPRDLVLLTATPVNNSLWDLYYLLDYFIKNDAVLAEHGVLSLVERFNDAMAENPFNLNPDTLYPVIDATTVKRTRQFVKKHYENDLITLPDGRRVPIRFPKPNASAITYSLNQALPGFLARLEQALDPPTGPALLTMARYQPENYPAGQPPAKNDLAIVGLIRSGLHKRFESSVHAFAETTGKMLREHDLFLKALDLGKVLTRDVLRELSAADDEDDIDELLADDERSEPIGQYNKAKLRAAVAGDRDLLAEMHEKSQAVRRPDDPKLAALVEELVRIVKQADHDGLDAEDCRQKRKVLVFSFYADTIDWIEEHLRRIVEEDERLAGYRGRIASVAGHDSRHGVTREQAVWGFAPESSQAPEARPGAERDRFDILLSTDVLAEGMNLQQCRNIINYDLPWNPMRLVQRHGRIDRIGSPHAEVFLRTVFPDDELDRLLNLEMRLRRKLAQAARSVGVEVAPLPDMQTEDRSFSETRAEIEALARHNPDIYQRGGTVGAAQTGEEYRQELRRALARQGDEIKNLPWKAGSGLAKGPARGHFFFAKVGPRFFMRFVPLAGGKIDSEIGTCLRLIECEPATPRVMPLDLKQTAFAAWEKARQHIFDSWMHETDPANLQPRVAKLNRDIIAYLRKHPAAGIDQKRLELALDALATPVQRRQENQLRAVFDADHKSAAARVQKLVETIEQLGLAPVPAPRPLAPIQPAEIHLICWLAIEAAEKRAE